MARSKEIIIGRNHTWDNVVLGTSKGWTLGKRQRAQQQCNRGIRIETCRKTTGRETVKRITNLLSHHKTARFGHCGGVYPFRNEKRDGK
jgi:hypothetical protein